MGDRTSIAGSVLLPPQLIGPDGRAYAIAQGDVQVQTCVPASHMQSINLLVHQWPNVNFWGGLFGPKSGSERFGL